MRVHREDAARWLGWRCLGALRVGRGRAGNVGVAAPVGERPLFPRARKRARKRKDARPAATAALRPEVPSGHAGPPHLENGQRDDALCVDLFVHEQEAEAEAAVSVELLPQELGPHLGGALLAVANAVLEERHVAAGKQGVWGACGSLPPTLVAQPK